MDLRAEESSSSVATEISSDLDLATPDEPADWPRPAHIGIAILIVVAHVATRHAAFTNVAGVWAGLLGATTFLAVARYATLWPARLPTLELVLVFFYTQFGLSVTVEPLPLGIWQIMPSPESFEAAGRLAFLCAGTLIAGFAFAMAGERRLGRPSFLAPLTSDVVTRAAAIYLPVSACWVLAVVFLPPLRQVLAPIVTALDSVIGKPPFAVVAAAAFLLAPSVGSRLRLIGAVAVLIVGMLQTSLLMEAVLPLGAAAALVFRARRRMPVALASAAVAILLILQPIKGTYRELHWYRGYGVVEAWTEAFLQRDESGEHVNATEATRSRMSELNVLAYTVELVPRVVPETGGKAYPVVLAALVPRLLWPDKPNLSKEGTDVFTIALGLQTELGAQTSGVGLSIPAHGYLEHGLFGSLMWTFLMGLVFGGITRLFGPTLPGTIAVGSVTLGLMYASAAGLVYFLGTVLQLVIAGTALTWLLHTAGRTALVRTMKSPVDRDALPSSAKRSLTSPSS